MMSRIVVDKSTGHAKLDLLNRIFNRNVHTHTKKTVKVSVKNLSFLINADNVLLHRRETSVVQWYSVLDFLIKGCIHVFFVCLFVRFFFFLTALFSILLQYIVNTYTAINNITPRSILRLYTCVRVLPGVIFFSFLGINKLSLSIEYSLFSLNIDD